MIIFDQLRVSDDGSQLYINAHVNKAEYFDNVTIKSITIQTAHKVLETDPCTPTSDYIYKKSYDNVKEISLVIDKGVLDEAFNGMAPIADATLSFDKTDFSQDLFFVYVQTSGAADECIPCSLQKEYTVGVTFDDNMYYQKVMGYVKSLQQDCTVHQDFIDFILQWNGFKASVETEHFIDARDFWERLFDKDIAEPVGMMPTYGTNICGCHG